MQYGLAPVLSNRFVLPSPGQVKHIGRSRPFLRFYRNWSMLFWDPPEKGVLRYGNSTGRHRNYPEPANPLRYHRSGHYRGTSHLAGFWKAFPAGEFSECVKWARCQNWSTYWGPKDHSHTVHKGFCLKWSRGDDLNQPAVAERVVQLLKFIKDYRARL